MVLNYQNFYQYKIHCTVMPKIVNCRFCGIKDTNYERRFCSIECADLFDNPFFYGMSKYRISKLTQAQKNKILRLNK